MKFRNWPPQTPEDKKRDKALLEEIENNRQLGLENDLKDWHIETLSHDRLTGLPSEEMFLKQLDGLVTRLHSDVAEEHRHDTHESLKKLSVIYLDLDNFKKMNDTYGHQAADEMLVQVAEIMRKTFRSTDMLARLHGDEFAIILPNTDAHTASDVAHKLHMAINEDKVMTAKSEKKDTVRITASIGVFSVDETNKMSTEEIVKAADMAMLDGKKSGRNKVIIYGSLPTTSE